MALSPNDIELERLKLWSDAIKIGLGAAIGVSGSVLALLVGHKHDREKEKAKRRRDALEKIIADFDKSFSIDLQTISYFHAAVESSIKNEPLAASLSMSNFRDQIMQAIPSSEALYGVESRLRLLGLGQCADALVDYGSTANRIRGILDHKKPPSLETLTRESGELRKMRTAFLEHVSRVW